MEGIGCFKNLKGLVINDNPITSLDLSKNKKLEYAIADSQSLTHVDVSGCDNLENLWVTADAQVAGLSNKMEVAHMIDECALPYTESTDRENSYTYAPDGRLIQALETSDYGTTASVYEYNAEGKPTKKQMLSDGEIQTTEVFDYDDQGRLASTKYVSDQGTGFVQNLSYDDKNRVSQLEIVNNAVSDTVSTYQYHYDNKGQLASVDVCEKYDGEIEAQGTYTLSYDENGNLICASVRTVEGYGKNYDNTFAYDDSENLIGETFVFYGSDGESTTLEYTYSLPDENGTIRATEETNGEAWIPELTFDENGRLIKEERFYEDDLLHRYEYSYTSEGMLKTCSEEPYGLRDHYFIPIAHYGKDVKDDTIQFNDFRISKYTPIRGYYTPEITRYEYGYADAVAGATFPEPADYPFSLISG